nr:unnamed protein product [Callosobruchus chinensis]
MRLRPSIVLSIKQEVPKRALGSNEQPGSAKKSLIQAFRNQHYSKHDLARTRFVDCLEKARIYIPSQEVLITIQLSHATKAQIRPSLEYCSHIWGAAAPNTLSIFDAVQRRAIRLFGDPGLTCHLQPLPPLSKPARCTRGTSSSHPRAVVLHTPRTRTERFNRTFVIKVSWAWNGLSGDVLVEPASVGLFKSRINKL